MVNIPYPGLLNYIMWKQGIDQKFYKIASQTRKELIKKVGCIIKQPTFSFVNMT